VWWLVLIILAAWEVEIQKIVVQGQPGKKVVKIPISVNKLGMVVYFCNSSYLGSVGRRIAI
jgi:hypothetical protein